VTPYAQAAHLTLPVSERDHVQGPETAPVTLVEYGDFECPYCGAAHPIVKAIQRQLEDQLRFVFRHFPLSTAHPHAMTAAEAAEAAGAQGRFWEMHDTLFENQQALDDVSLVTYARALGLDVERFEREMAAHVYAPRVREDFVSGVLSGVNGTPTFFINGARHDGSWDAESLLEALQEAGAR
jgi:protein-disulfide isomerase